VSTRKTSVEIDQELLVEVRRILHTSTVRETVERAFREVVQREARRQEVVALSTMGGGWTSTTRRS
jgi:Arc/MetJ family transcription regulator